MSTILDEAFNLVHSSRQSDYGHPLDNWSDIAAIWNVLLRPKLREPISAEDAALLMIGLKLAREAHRQKRDNRVDVAGYVEVLETIIEERGRRGGG